MLKVKNKRKCKHEMRIQKWIFELKLNVLREKKLKNTTKNGKLSKNELIQTNSLRNTYLKLKLQKFNSRLIFTNFIWNNLLTRCNRIHHVKIIYYAQILNSTQIKNWNSRQNIKKWIVHKKNDKLLKRRKFKKKKKISRSKLNETTRTFQRIICFKFENLKSIEHEKMHIKNAKNIIEKIRCRKKLPKKINKKFKFINNKF